MSLSTLNHQKAISPSPRSELCIHEDVIIEILMRLSVKSLLKCRCVSKRWLALISSSEFARTHYDFQSKVKNKLLMFDLYSRKLNLFSILHFQPSPYSITYDCSFDSPEDASYFIGYCKGLMCFRGKSLFVWNPSIRKLKKIPDVWVSDEAIYQFGFGVDRETGDFKIVYVYPEKTWENKFLVYSLKYGSWEKVQAGFNSKLIFPHMAVYASGSLNWCLSNKPSNIWKWQIISFNLTTHTSSVIAFPNHIMAGVVHLSESRGLLFVSCLYKREMKVWVMKEYGIEESWTMLVTVPNILEWPISRRMREDGSELYLTNAVSVPFISKNIDILVRVNQCLRLYKSETETCSYLNIFEPFDKFSHAVSYTETLFSPCSLDD